MPDTRNMNITAAIGSAVVAVVLVGMKLWALGETRALSVAASLTDSALDVMTAFAGIAAILYAARPADEDHAFGHSSAEDLAALAQSLFILVSSGIIAWAAVTRMLAGEAMQLENQGRGIVVMVASIVLSLGLVIWQRRVARRTGNRVIMANSLNHLGDVVPAIGAIGSLWASAAFDLPQIDNIVAIGAALLLAMGAVNIFKGAWDALMDRAADPKTIAGIEEIVRGFPGVHGFHDLKTRTAGSMTFVNLHIELDGQQTLDEAHAIGAALRRAILKEFPETDVLIHKDPVGVEPHPDDPSRR